MSELPSSSDRTSTGPENGETRPGPLAPRLDADLRRRPATLVLEPDPPDNDPPVARQIHIDAYTVATNETPDCAHAWVDCPHGPDCPYRARVGRLYHSEEEAIKAVPHYLLEQIGQSFKQYPSPLDAARYLEPIALFPEYHVLHLVGTFSGRDYRVSPCRLEDPYHQLAWGSANDPAWRTVRHHKDNHGIAGAVLPIGPSDLNDAAPASAYASLFLFRGGLEDVSVSPLCTVPGSIPV